MALPQHARRKVPKAFNNHKARQKHPTPQRISGGGGPMVNHPAEATLHISGAALMSSRDHLARARNGFAMKPRRAGGSE